MDVIKDQVVYKVNKRSKIAIVHRIQSRNQNAEITIPFEIESCPVAEIAAHAFKGSRHLEKIILPGTIKKIQASAFAECINLKTVIHRGNGILELGYEAFNDCPALSYFSSLGTVKLIASNVFSNCTELKNLDCQFCGKIPDNSFRHCTQLEEISFGFSETKICSGAFVGCKNLKRIISRGKIEFSNTLENRLKKCEIHCYNDSSLIDLAYTGQKIIIIEDTLPF